jgi:hypothetical protein
MRNRCFDVCLYFDECERFSGFNGGSALQQLVGAMARAITLRDRVLTEAYGDPDRVSR